MAETATVIAASTKDAATVLAATTKEVYQKLKSPPNNVQVHIISNQRDY